MYEYMIIYSVISVNSFSSTRLRKIYQYLNSQWHSAFFRRVTGIAQHRTLGPRRSHATIPGYSISESSETALGDVQTIIFLSGDA